MNVRVVKNVMNEKNVKNDNNERNVKNDNNVRSVMNVNNERNAHHAFPLSPPKTQRGTPGIIRECLSL